MNQAVLWHSISHATKIRAEDKKSPNQNERQIARKQIDIGAYLLSTGLLKHDPVNSVSTQLFNLLYHNFQYPIEESCQTHLNANRLGEFDLHKKSKLQQYPQSQIQQFPPSIACYDWVQHQDKPTPYFIDSDSDDFEEHKTQYPLKKQDQYRIKQVCECCYNIVQTTPLTFQDCIYHTAETENLGPSTYLLFKTIRFLLLCSLSLLVVYCVFIVVVNKKSSIQYRKDFVSSQGDVDEEQKVTFRGLNAFASGSKLIHGSENNVLTYALSCCIAFLMVFVWGVIYIRYKRSQNLFYYQELRRDKRYIRIELFSLQFRNLPATVSETQLESQLMQWLNPSKSFPDFDRFTKKVRKSKQKQIYQHLKDYKIYSNFLQKYQQQKKNTNLNNDPKYRTLKSLIEGAETVIKNEKKLINLIMIQEMNRASLLYYDDKKQSTQQKQMRQNLEKTKKPFVKYIKMLCNDQVCIPSQQYDKLKKEYIQSKLQYSKEKKANLKSTQARREQKQGQENKQPYFVTFTHQMLVQMICHKLKEQLFVFKFEQNGETKKRVIKIREAPEPQDVKWENIGQHRGVLYLKRVLSYLVAGVLLTIVFAILFTISTIKAEKRLFGLGTATTFLISLVVMLFNRLIRGTLYYLTRKQRNRTHSIEQTSMALKAVIAVIINTTIIRLFVPLFMTNNIFGIGGLSEDVMTFAIINSILSPLFKAIKLSYYLKKAWYFIKQKIKPLDKFEYTQKQYNDLILRRVRSDFELGTEYIDIVNIYLFMCFYVSLQPLIVIPITLYFFIINYAKKILLFQYCKRPIPCNNTLNQTMFYFISAGPILFVVGNIFFSTLYTHANRLTYINIASLIISIVFFILLRLDIVTKDDIGENKSKRDIEYEYFYNVKNNIQNNYDLLNPVTSSLGQLQKFKKFENKSKTIQYSRFKTKIRLVEKCLICSTDCQLRECSKQQQNRILLETKQAKKRCCSCGLELYKRKQLCKRCVDCNAFYCKVCSEMMIQQMRDEDTLIKYSQHQAYYDGKKSNKVFNEHDTIEQQISNYYLPLLGELHTSHSANSPLSMGYFHKMPTSMH